MTVSRPSRRTALAMAAVAAASWILGIASADRGERRTGDGAIPLPEPTRESSVSVEAAMSNRRSRRAFDDRPLTLRELGQVLWSMQGITDPETGFRVAPSAGGLYPLELYVVVGDPGVQGIDRGVYHYRPSDHGLDRVRADDVQPDLQAAALDQAVVGEGAIDVVVCGADERTTRKYGERGRQRYVPMEAGHAGENLYLQAESLGLATVAIGAFSDERVRSLVGAPDGQRPLYLFPIGGRIR